MIPNPNIYGAPEDWIYAPVSEGRDIGCKLAPWQTLGNAILGWGGNNPVLELNEQLDPSISFCGIGADSPISTVHVIDYVNHEILDSITPTVTNWCLSYYDSRYSVTNSEYSEGGNKDNILLSPIETLGDTNIHRFLRPIVDIDPKECIILISIEAVNSDGTGNWVGSIFDYENQYSEAYPNIVAVWGTIYSRPTAEASIRLPWTFSNEYTGSYVSRLIEYPVSSPEWGNVINYAAPSPSNTAAGSGNNRFIIWGSVNTSGTFPSIGGTDDRLHDTIHRLVHEYSRDWVLSCVASLGLFFTDRIDTAQSGDLDSPTMYCGTIDDNGITHGEYTQGTANRQQRQYNWESTTESKYDPSIEVPDYDTKNHLNPYISIADFNTEYVCNYQTVRALCSEIYKALARKPSDVQTVDYSADTFLVTDPLEGIISIRKFPVDNVPRQGADDFIKIGNYTSDTVKAFRFAPSLNKFITFTFSGSKRLNEEFGGSFLDREPYTTAELYIPFCGTLPISVADYIGHTITVKMAIDYRTGSCTAYVFKDSTPLQSANGQIGIDIPVTGVNTAAVDSQLMLANLRLNESQRQQFQASTAFFTTPASIAGSLLGGKFGLTQAAGSLGGLTSMGSNFETSWDRREAASYELHHIQTPYKSISAGSPLCSAMGEHCCRLTIYRPILMRGYDPVKYGHTVGFAVLLTDTLSDHNGYCVTASCDLSGVTCTAEERSMIDSALKGGVYL